MYRYRVFVLAKKRKMLYICDVCTRSSADESKVVKANIATTGGITQQAVKPYDKNKVKFVFVKELLVVMRHN